MSQIEYMTKFNTCNNEPKLLNLTDVTIWLCMTQSLLYCDKVVLLKLLKAHAASYKEHF